MIFGGLGLAQLLTVPIDLDYENQSPFSYSIVLNAIYYNKKSCA